MRNELLTAYSLHQRPFQDKRTIYYLLTKEYGIVHGVAKKGIPQFSPLTLFATGKKSLKTFQQVTITDNVPTLTGVHQYAALYINEITLKLLPLEDEVRNVFVHYDQVIYKLQHESNNKELRLALRIYENALFEELGIAVDLIMDSHQQPIDAERCYSFTTSTGWVMIDENTKNSKMSHGNLKAKSGSLDGSNSDKDSLTKTSFYNMNVITGRNIIKMQEGINLQTLIYWEPIHKQLIDFLFDYQPLQSRILWHQYHRYQ